MHIGIVGLGLGGATAAAALTARGCDVTVFEQAPRPGEVGAGIATWPNTIRLLYRLGLGDHLAEIGFRMREAQVRDKGGALLHAMASKSYDDAPGYYFHRAELLETIVERIPPGAIRRGMRCLAAEEIGDKVRLSFEGGLSAHFDAVVGADGIKSAVYPAIGHPEPPIYSNLAAYRGVIDNTPKVDLDISALWTDRMRYFVAFPVSGGRRVNFVGVVPTPGRPGESWFMTGNPEALVREFHDWDPLVRRILGEVRETFRWGLYFREPAPRMVRGRIALLGDAAHPMLIHAGQGAGQAIEDAFALAVLLEGAGQQDVLHRLKLYEALRRERAAAVQAASRINAQYLHKDFPLAPGETRPDRTSPTDWIIDYDVEREAMYALAEDRAG